MRPPFQARCCTAQAWLVDGSFCALLVRWGERVTPLGESAMTLPPCEKTALEMVNEIRANQDPHGRSREGLMSPVFAETRVPVST